jgi:hypothetical protein
LFAPHSAVFLSCEGYQSPIIRASLHEAGIRSCIPPKSNRKAKNPLEQAHVSRAQLHLI